MSEFSGVRYCARVTGLVLLVIGLSWPGWSGAQEPKSLHGRLGLEYGQRFLSDNNPDQNWLRADLLGYLTKHSDYTISFERASLFDEIDRTVGAGYYYSVHPSVDLSVGGTYSATHNVLPRTSYYSGVSFYSEGSGFLSFTASRTDYDTPVTESFSTTLGWSNSSYQVAYTPAVSRIESGSNLYSHTVSYDHFYPGGSRQYVSLSGGKQPQELSENETLGTEFYSVSLGGLISVESFQTTQRQGITYQVTAMTLEDEYDSVGVSLGVRNEF